MTSIPLTRLEGLSQSTIRSLPIADILVHLLKMRLLIMSKVVSGQAKQLTRAQANSAEVDRQLGLT